MHHAGESAVLSLFPCFRGPLLQEQTNLAFHGMHEAASCMRSARVTRILGPFEVEDGPGVGAQAHDTNRCLVTGQISGLNTFRQPRSWAEHLSVT